MPFVYCLHVITDSIHFHRNRGVFRHILLIWNRFYEHGLTLIPWISYHMSSELWDEMTHPFPNVSGCNLIHTLWGTYSLVHARINCNPCYIKGPLGKCMCSSAYWSRLSQKRCTWNILVSSSSHPSSVFASAKRFPWFPILENKSPMSETHTDAEAGRGWYRRTREKAFDGFQPNWQRPEADADAANTYGRTCTATALEMFIFVLNQNVIHILDILFHLVTMIQGVVV